MQANMFDGLAQGLILLAVFIFLIGLAIGALVAWIL